MPRRRRINWIFWLVLAGLAFTFVGYVLVGTYLPAIVGGIRGDRDLVFSKRFMERMLEAVFATWMFSVGACVGSFLNVVVWRMPRGLPITGFSMCPYCRLSIQGQDNVPILGWIRLRGRCRNCRLPISSRYPFVELLTGLVFLAVFAAQVVTQGGNLPGKSSSPDYGLLLGFVDWTILVRALGWVTWLSVLIAMGLISRDQQSIPPRLLFFGIVVPVGLGLIFPDFYVVPWKSNLSALDTLSAESSTMIDLQVTPRVMALMNSISGITAGIFVARVAAGGLFQGFDTRLVSNNDATRDARNWTAALAVAGVGLGWQAAISIGLLLMILIFLLRWIVPNAAAWVRSPSMLLFFAATMQLSAWRWLDSYRWWPGQDKEVAIYAMSIVAIGLFAQMIRWPSVESEPPQKSSNFRSIDHRTTTAGSGAEDNSVSEMDDIPDSDVDIINKNTAAVETQINHTPLPSSNLSQDSSHESKSNPEPLDR